MLHVIGHILKRGKKMKKDDEEMFIDGMLRKGNYGKN
jgi:hypothetical protein